MSLKQVIITSKDLSNLCLCKLSSVFMKGKECYISCLSRKFLLTQLDLCWLDVHRNAFESLHALGLGILISKNELWFLIFLCLLGIATNFHLAFGSLSLQIIKKCNSNRRHMYSCLLQ